MLTNEQLQNNLSLLLEKEKSESEYKEYVNDLQRQKELFIKENPMFPIKKFPSMFAPVHGARTVGGIFYVE